jgi:hypothetical protein
MGDWLPRKREEQLAMGKKWAEVLNEKGSAFDVPEAEVITLAHIVEKADEQFQKYQVSDKSSVITAETDAIIKQMTDYMRHLKRRKFYIPPLSRADFLSLDLKPPDTTRTDHYDVSELVEFELTLRAIRETVVNFWVKGAANRAKPEGYEGAVIIWGVLDKPPTDLAELTSHTMASRTPHILEFKEEERGKRVYVALCWQNERGLTGAWSEIQSAIIP